MNSSGEAAESIVRMSLQGFEVAARITGVGAKNIAAILYTVLKDKNKTKGKTSLAKMLRTNKELKIFSIKNEDLKKFTEEAKRYGVLFTALVDKKLKGKDGIVDIMVKAEDASKINRIVERFNLSAVDSASIKSEIHKTRDSKNKETKVSMEDKIVDDILSKTPNKEEHERSNPSSATTKQSPQSEPISNYKDEGNRKQEKPSVREEMKRIKKEMQKEKLTEEKQEVKKPQKQTVTKHKQVKKKKPKERSF